MDFLNQTLLLLKKDLILEVRRRENLLTMFFFGTLLLFVFHFSFDLVPERVVEMAPGSALVGISFHWHFGTRATFRGGAGESLP